MADLDVEQFFAAEFDEHAKVVEATRAAVAKPFAHLLSQAARAIRDGNKILFFGNGGSAADAQHLATELVVRYKQDRAAIPAIALTTDSSALTAIGNEFRLRSPVFPPDRGAGAARGRGDRHLHQWTQPKCSAGPEGGA